jgi:hypothetical protein
MEALATSEKLHVLSILASFSRPSSTTFGCKSLGYHESSRLVMLSYTVFFTLNILHRMRHPTLEDATLPFLSSECFFCRAEVHPHVLSFHLNLDPIGKHCRSSPPPTIIASITRSTTNQQYNARNVYQNSTYANHLQSLTITSLNFKPHVSNDNSRPSPQITLLAKEENEALQATTSHVN